MRDLIGATPPASVPQSIFRVVLGGFLGFAGVSHLVVQDEFLAQVPDWVPLDGGFVVIASGIVEIILGGALILFPKQRAVIGWIVAAFFVAIFPGNISQYVKGVDAFGLDSDAARAVRLLFQPVLVAWALWSTGAWRAFVSSRTRG